MKRLTILALLSPLLLAACGSSPAGNPDPNGTNVSIGATANDSASSVTVARTITPATATTPESVKYTVGASGAATFVFTARPGGNAAYITSYKVVRASINGVDQASNDTVVLKNNMYVASGYSCTPSLGSDQSCSFQDPTAKPANGVPSGPISIDFAGDLASLARAKNANIVEDFDIEFYGVSTNNVPVTVRLNHVIARALFIDA